MVQRNNCCVRPSQSKQEIMNMLTAEQLIAAHKANVETLFGLTGKAFEGIEKLVELNLQVAKTALGEVTENTKAVLKGAARALRNFSNFRVRVLFFLGKLDMLPAV